MAGVYTYPVATGMYGREPVRRPDYAGQAMTLPGAPNVRRQAAGYENDPLLVAYRQLAMRDAAARSAGARLTARNASPNDPSLAAYGQLEGQLRGQSDASRGMMETTAGFLRMKEQERWQEYLLRLQAEIRRREMEQANRGGLAGDLMSMVGTVGGAYLVGR